MSRDVAAASLSRLRTAWDVAVRARTLRECRELTRLAQQVGDIETLAEVAGPVAASLAGSDARAVSALAMTIAGSGALWPAADELRSMAEACLMAGEPDTAAQLLRRGLDLPDVAMDARARLQLRLAGWHQQRGELEVAESLLSEAGQTFEQLGDSRSQAITLGKVADILSIRGDIHEALRIRMEVELPVYERLGDVRSRAVTMGQVADDLCARGQLDDALRIRTLEELPVYERLGDVRERAVTLGKIADILVIRGQLDEALRIRTQEELPAYKDLGAARERAVTLGKIADILVDRCEFDAALHILQDDVLPVLEGLGAARDRAIMFDRIADILVVRGQLDEALRIRTQEQLPVYDRLRDVRERANTLAKIADIFYARRQLDEAIDLRVQVLPMYEALDDARSLCVAAAKYAQLLLAQPTPARLVEARHRLQQSVEIAERLQLPIRDQVRSLKQVADNTTAGGV